MNANITTASDDSFTLKKPTINDLVLLERNNVEPIAKPIPLFMAGRKVGKVKQTIGRVDSPLYVASLEPNMSAKDIKGRKLTIQK